MSELFIGEQLVISGNGEFLEVHYGNGIFFMVLNEMHSSNEVISSINDLEQIYNDERHVCLIISPINVL